MSGSILNRTHSALGWPTRARILEPSEPGASAVARLASNKIRRSLAGYPGAEGLAVGVLAVDGESTEPPLAVVCEFATPVPEETLLQAQRLAWNFNRSLLLVTAEPHAVRVWSCYETPVVDRYGDGVASDLAERLALVEEPDSPHIVGVTESSDESWTAEAITAGLHWASLVSGAFVRRHAERFPTEKKADKALLDNLRAVRDRLRERGLPDEYSHDLLARVIFVQFLFDRKDSQGRAALDADELDQLRVVGRLAGTHETLSGVLGHYDDAYALFDYLNERFNGDLFPGQGPSSADPDDVWAEERGHVEPHHLSLLAQFVDGSLDLTSGQANLWPLYAFDAIPLDLISSIYEQFVDKEGGTGIHYTPGHLVDLVLDSVLPWDGDGWDVRVLDPACGSGIFLVKAYQRLVHRWKRAEGQDAVPIPVLKRLLTQNVFGVDKDPGAVRVAAFSLYLAMCDEIEPRDYWSHSGVRFPALQGRRLVEADFFAEDVPGIRTVEDAGSYDVVVGNPPFGDRTIRDSEAAAAWAADHDWPVANLDVGTVFIGKAAELTRAGGAVGLVQSAAALMYNRHAAPVRRRVFLDHRRVEGVTLFAQFPLFDDARPPTCVVVIRNDPADGSDFWYAVPKRHSADGDARRIVLDRHDVQWVSPYDVVENPWLWEVLAWGGPRDRALVRELRAKPNLEGLRVAGDVSMRVGVNRGNREKAQPALVGRPILETPSFPTDGGLLLSPSALPINEDAATDAGASTGMDAFALPQLVVKLSWIQRVNRFQARLVGEAGEVATSGEGVLCSQSYASVHGPPDVITLAALTINSALAMYYLFMTSGRFAFKRPQPNPSDFYRIPLPLGAWDDGRTKAALAQDGEDVDPVVYDLFGFTEAERILIEDVASVTIPDFNGPHPKPGYAPTPRGAGADGGLLSYGRVFCRVLAAAFGDAMGTRIEVVEEEGAERLPVRVVRVVVGEGVESAVSTVSVPPSTTFEELAVKYALSDSGGPARPVSHAEGRCLTVYEGLVEGGHDAAAFTFVKPDLVRYWTRSVALRDADALVADLGAWRAASAATASEALA